MLYVPQRLFTAFWNWRPASAMYIPDEEPRMTSENQSTNSTKSLAPFHTFPKKKFVFQQNSRIHEPLLLLLARDDTSPHRSLHSMTFIFHIMLIALFCSLIFLSVHEREKRYCREKRHTSFGEGRPRLMSLLCYLLPMNLSKPINLYENHLLYMYYKNECHEDQMKQ